MASCRARCPFLPCTSSSWTAQRCWLWWPHRCPRRCGWPRGIRYCLRGSGLGASLGKFLPAAPCLSFPIYRRVTAWPGPTATGTCGQRTAMGHPRGGGTWPWSLGHLDLQVLILVRVTGAVPGVIRAKAGAAHLPEKRGALLPPQPGLQMLQLHLEALALLRLLIQ